jgi:hypothetical protein
MQRKPFTPPYKARRLQRERAVLPRTRHPTPLNVEPFVRAMEKASVAMWRLQQAMARGVR